MKKKLANYRGLAMQHPLWNSFRYMRQVTNNPNNPEYPHCGGVGVICAWNRFWDFVKDIEDHLGSKPTGGILVRKDQHKNFEIGNLEWGNAIVRGNRQDYCILLTWGNKTQSIALWARELNANKETLYYRYKKGWTTEEVLIGRGR